MERVWDYPRPPALRPVAQLACVEHAGATIARSRRALRVLETSHPPTIYVPPADVAMQHLRPSAGHGSLCEFKGLATFWDLVVGDAVAERAAWSYLEPVRAYAALRDHVAFFPGRVDACHLGDERVDAQAGDFYGGWITAELVGPFKGAPGTLRW